MFGYFWSRNATLGMAALYLVLGIVLLLFPGMSGTVFCWGLAAGAGLYAAGNFWRWHQGKKQGYSLPGLLLAGLLAAVLCLVCIFRPQFILSFLPLVLGIVLIANPFGVAKTVIRFFGIGLIVDGVCDLITVLSARGR